MKNVVVTGGNGFIGSPLISNLTEKGYNVFAIVRNKEKIGYSENEQVKYIYADMSNYSQLDQMLPVTEIDTLYHLAWDSSSGDGRGNYRIQCKNIEYSCDLLMACQRMKCKRFLFASSIMEYEVYKQMQLAEVPPRSSIYSTGKLAADYMLKALANSYCMDYISLLLSNVYGPGECSPRLINSSIRKMLKGERCSFSSGDQLYDFIYIDDAIDMMIALEQDGKGNKIYYIGNSRPMALKDFLMMMHEQVAPDSPIGLGDLPSPIVELAYSEFDTDAVFKDTGVVPKVDFKEGIQKTVDYIKESDDELCF